MLQGVDVSGEENSNETSRADDMWVKEQIVVDCWKVFILFLLLNIPCPF